MTPNFLCVGAQKAGTTTLFDILKQHPAIFFPSHKEAHFLNKEEYYAKGLDWWLEEFFSKYNQESIMGLFTPEYMYFEEILERIIKLFGTKLKIIFVLRHPVDRAYSHYLMSRRRGFEELPFMKAIESEPERIKKSEFERNHFSYIDRGHYSRQIEPFVKAFKPNQVMFLSFENDIKSNIKNTINRIQTFLEIEHKELKTDIKSNRSTETRFSGLQKFTRGNNIFKKALKRLLPSKFRRSVKRKVLDLNQKELSNQEHLSEAERNLLYDKYYGTEVDQLLKLTGIDFSYWKSKQQSKI